MVYKGKTAEIITNALNKGLQNYGLKGGVATGWDKGQEKLDFCGVKTYSDWGSTIFDAKGTKKSVRFLLHTTTAYWLW